MKELHFQQKAVRELVDKTIDLLRLSGNRRTLIFKAPTGAGKTVMASQLLADLTEELQTRADMPYNQVAYIWIAPNKLHQQSYFKMKNYFTETRLLRAVHFSCKWIAEHAGINKNVSFHTSRHTFATLTLSACNDLKLVSELLGHKSVKTTQRYADVMLANKTEAVNRVGAVFTA